jgi:CubicO group peptidase (beta-lactamase class C family)
MAVLAAGCSDSGADDAASTTSTGPTSTKEPSAGRGGADLTFPGAAWATTSAADAGMDQAALDRLGAQARAAGSSCVVVTRDGEVVYDAVWPGPTMAPREAFSVTKSLTSILIGIAQRDGHLSVTDPVSEYVPQWKGTPSEHVTIEDVLSNTSGREWSLATDYGAMAIRERDKTGFAIGLGQAAGPGTVWAYNNSAIQVLSAVILAATGQSAADYAEAQVFGPLGMADSTVRTDGAGNSLTFMGLSTTCQDLARMGLMMLAQGSWGSGDDRTEVLPSSYVEDSTGRSSSELNAAYGWLWWVNRPGMVASPTAAVTAGDPGPSYEGQLVPGAPEDTFWALGFQGQYVAVIPEDGIVAVRLGAEPPEDPPFGVAEFTDGVLAAVDR